MLNFYGITDSLCSGMFLDVKLGDFLDDHFKRMGDTLWRNEFCRIGDHDHDHDHDRDHDHDHDHDHDRHPHHDHDHDGVRQRLDQCLASIVVLQDRDIHMHTNPSEVEYLPSLNKTP